jgi:hypothetical protein
MPKKLTASNLLKQTEIVTTIYTILNLNQNNNFFYLQDIDADIDKQNAIYALEPEIKKNFLCGNWSSIKTKVQDRKWYNIVKNVFKACGIEYSTKTKNITNKDGTVTSLTQFTVIIIDKTNLSLDQKLEILLNEKVELAIQNMIKSNDKINILVKNT